nr:DUF4258 domain-containing protein [uncultured Devosia sp.]
MNKPVVYTQHAQQALAERELDLSWVERVIRAPQWREADPDPAVTRYFGAVPERGGRYLRVACVENDENIRIVSAFLDRRARPR